MPLIFGFLTPKSIYYFCLATTYIWFHIQLTLAQPEELIAYACENGEYYPHESTCQKYYQCANGELVEYTCPNGTYFDFEKEICDHEENVDCHLTSTTTQESSPPTTRTTTQASPPTSTPEFVCEHGDYYPDYDDCQSYFICADGELKRFTCPGELYYNYERRRCDYLENVDCTGRSTPTPPPAPTTTADLSTTTEGTSSTTEACRHGEQYPDFEDCQNYFICLNEVMHPARCSDGFYFDIDLSKCLPQDFVNCNGRPTQGPIIGTTTAVPTTTTMEPTTTEEEGSTLSTSTEAYGFCSLHPCGIYPHLFNANQFYLCPANFSTDLITHACAPGLVYSSRVSECVPDTFCSFQESCGLYSHPHSATLFYLCLANHRQAVLECAAGTSFSSTSLQCEINEPTTTAIPTTTTPEPTTTTMETTTEEEFSSTTDDYDEDGSSSTLSWLEAESSEEGQQGRHDEYQFNSEIVDLL